MVDLEDQKWMAFEHAYGRAVDIPKLLRHLPAFPEEKDYRSEPFFSLWSALCHQGDVYTASYAAVPHVVRCVETAPERATLSYFLLPVSIELARVEGRGPRVPADLAADYFHALKRLGIMAELEASRRSDPEVIRTLQAAVAVSKGDLDGAAKMLEPEDE